MARNKIGGRNDRTPTKRPGRVAKKKRKHRNDKKYRGQGRV